MTCAVVADARLFLRAPRWRWPVLLPVAATIPRPVDVESCARVGCELILSKKAKQPRLRAAAVRSAVSRINSKRESITPSLPTSRQHMNRLVRWLNHGNAYIAVTARDIERVSSAVNLAAQALGKYEVVSVSLSERLKKMRPPTPAKSSAGQTADGGDPLDVAKELISSIRTSTKSVLVVIEDADLVSVERLERLRIALESERVAGPPPRLVLCGTSVLGNILENRNARGLASRVGHRLDLDH